MRPSHEANVTASSRAPGAPDAPESLATGVWTLAGDRPFVFVGSYRPFWSGRAAHRRRPAPERRTGRFRAVLALCDPETGRPTEGDIGELLIGGATLAHGYLGREDLTGERFRTDIPGLPGRWYRSGDLVRTDAHGVLTYLGRADQQLKVDGFRIEPGEIELVLMAHPAVRDAVVTAPDIPGAGRQLVAHLVLDAGQDAQALAPALRSHLRARLPEYMVPVRFVALAALPTTPSGTIDRRALPLPAAAPARAVDRSDLRGLCRALWQELLGLDTLADDQNLFDLGARSLLVLRFVSQLKEAGISHIGVADIYDRPTVAGIAASGQAAGRRRSAGGSRREATAGIAIIGMASRTPGAADVEAFWDNLLAGREGIRHFSPAELDASVPASLREAMRAFILVCAARAARVSWRAGARACRSSSACRSLSCRSSMAPTCRVSSRKGGRVGNTARISGIATLYTGTPLDVLPSAAPRCAWPRRESPGGAVHCPVGWPCGPGWPPWPRATRRRTRTRISTTCCAPAPTTR